MAARVPGATPRVSRKPKKGNESSLVDSDDSDIDEDEDEEDEAEDDTGNDVRALAWVSESGGGSGGGRLIAATLGGVIFEVSPLISSSLAFPFSPTSLCLSSSLVHAPPPLLFLFLSLRGTRRTSGEAFECTR